MYAYCLSTRACHTASGLASLSSTFTTVAVLLTFAPTHHWLDPGSRQTVTGTPESPWVGLEVGVVVGIDVGLVVGRRVGLTVGLVGADVGVGVGLVVGFVVGVDVGLVGLEVGEDVGLGVGTAVGPEPLVLLVLGR